jgi:hypothetical protein
VLVQLSWDEAKRLAAEFPEQIFVLHLPFHCVHLSMRDSSFAIESMP